MDNIGNSSKIIRDGFILEGSAETCFSISNGRFAVRGTTDELYDTETPGTYVAGIFDKNGSAVSELVNLPYPFGMRIYINREPVDLRACNVEYHTRELDMKTGVYTRRYSATDKRGRTFSVKIKRFASMANRDFGCAVYEVCCDNFTGVINIESFIELDVFNNKNNPNDRVRHFTANLEAGNTGVRARCLTENYSVGIASSTQILDLSDATKLNEYYREYSNFAAQYLEFDVEREGAVIKLERFVSFATGDAKKADIVNNAVNGLEKAINLGSIALLKAHTDAMGKLWEKADFSIEGDPEIDHALRFCLYTLICCVNPDDDMVSIGARGMHGEGYKGHVFWDTEVFMLPFFIYSLPDHAKALLRYRYNTLAGARENARLGGFEGARYPWESADTGLEETPRCGFDYKGRRSEIKTGDLEIHITGDVAYALREYVRASGDTQFLEEYGAEIIIETARFWASRLEYNASKDRYEINNVIGPDEFHEHVNNSAYTNALAQWNLLYAARCVEQLKSKGIDCKGIDLNIVTESTINHWRELAEKIHIPTANGLIEQFDGYFELKDREVTAFDSNQMPLWPEDVDVANLNDYTLVKQGDVIMLMHLLGEQYSFEEKRNNYMFYEKRTMHKSSLGPSMYALMGARTGQHAKAYTNFRRTVMTDIADNQGNSAQGIHAASAGGAWCALFYGFCGISVDKNDRLCIDPWLPEKWTKVSLSFDFQGRRLKLSVTGKDAVLEQLSGPKGFVAIINGNEVEI